MSDYIIRNGELYHYGVKGMKWGHRRAARQTYRTAKNRAFSKYEREINDIEKGYKRGQMLSKKDQAREARAESNYQKAVSKAKSDYKQAKKNINAEYKQSKIDAKNAKAQRKTKKRASLVNTASNALFAKGMSTMVGAAVTMSGHKKAGEVIFKAGDVAAKAYIAKYGVDVARDAYDRSKAKRK